ncbi:hypothetical protein GOBAR_AA28536 [Gossypium barbadense]|uniref:Uncharacterized protein n=1 Tax=Gossypium barbadense TaxID=3634 RepID=A0A2P5WM20_GOSBA|nr:hypothetical protein GOBAR_AA28536 [Gossypium barbadense]
MFLTLNYIDYNFRLVVIFKDEDLKELNQTPQYKRHSKSGYGVPKSYFMWSNCDNCGAVSDGHGKGGNNNFEVKREFVGEWNDDKHGSGESEGVGNQENRVGCWLGCINGFAYMISFLPYSARRVDTNLEGNGSYEGCYY